MQKLLIAESSAVFSAALADALSDTYEIICCSTGIETLKMLESHRPQILIINLALPYMDGLQVLCNTSYKPAAVLVLTTLSTDYALQTAKDAGADFAVLLPCTVQSVVYHVRELTRMTRHRSSHADPQQITQTHLLRLGLSSHRTGFTQLRVGIPIFAQDESQLMKKELYPAIAALCGNDNPEQVERTIREVIREAWECRDQAIWEEYFPGRTEAPSNKVFIAALAQKLRQSAPERIW